MSRVAGALDAVLPLITADKAKALMVALAKVPSPLTALFEAEPQLRAFIDVAVEPQIADRRISAPPADHRVDLVAAQRQAAAVDAEAVGESDEAADAQIGAAPTATHSSATG